MDWTESELRIF